MKPTVGIGVVILRQREAAGLEVVLIQRGKPPRQGQWSIPGGKQEYGETVRAAARREACEETGLEIAVGDLLDVVDLIDPDHEIHYTLVDFSAQAIGGTLQAGSDAAAAEWVPLEDAIARVPWEETRRILRLAAVRYQGP